MTGTEATSLLAYTGFGGAVACCAILEVLGGAAVLGGFGGSLGLATEVTYLTIVGAAGLVAVLFADTYRRSDPAST